MYTSMGWGVYVFFATSLIAASIYAYFFIHDTKGLRMDQMDQLFGYERKEQIPESFETTKKLTEDKNEHTEKVANTYVDRV
jgi:hypothetical protein